MNIKSIILTAIYDIYEGLKRYKLSCMLGWQDVRQRYLRSTLGPFWITISMALLIGIIGIVFGQIFKAPMADFLPFLALGIILWGFVSSVITEGCMSFISSSGMIKQLSIPLFVYVTKMIWRNTIIFFHNIIIFPVVLIIFFKTLTWLALLSIPGFILLVVNLGWIAVMLGTICTRYRDLAQIVTSFIQVFFYLTPIIWMPELLPDRAGLFLLDMNPFYHLLEVVRAPLLGQNPSSFSWFFVSVMAVVGWFVALVFYGRYKSRIAYWL